MVAPRSKAGRKVSKARVKRGRPGGARSSFTADKKDTFIDNLRATGNVTFAAESIGYTRRSAYYYRDPQHALYDAEFAARWRDALEGWVDALEQEGYRRAIGVEHPVTRSGQVVLVPADPADPKSPGVPLMVRKSSDLLLIFYMKAHRHQYRDKLDLGGSGSPVSDHALSAKDALVAKLFPAADPSKP